jgi:hypothetical protein
MSPITSLVLTSLLLLAMLGTGAGAWLERRRQPCRPFWQNRALGDALLPGAGWCSLFVLDGLLTLLGVQQLPLGLKHLLGTLALLLLYYAVLSTLYLIYRSGIRNSCRSGIEQKTSHNMEHPVSQPACVPDDVCERRARRSHRAILRWLFAKPAVHGLHRCGHRDLEQGSELIRRRAPQCKMRIHSARRPNVTRAELRCAKSAAPERHADVRPCAPPTRRCASRLHGFHATARWRNEEHVLTLARTRALHIRISTLQLPESIGH